MINRSDLKESSLIFLLLTSSVPLFLFAQETESFKGRCLTPYIINSIIHSNASSGIQRPFDLIRRQTDTSILSPSGKFRIHFDTSAASTNLPAMVDGNGNRIPHSHYQYADTVAKIFDSVWTVEITTFNFVPPPPDSAGGGNEYDIYLQDLGAGNFGGTQYETTFAVFPGKINPRFPSFIIIDNDFGTGFRTKGVAAVKVTAAHEFFHAIQLGGYGTWFDQFYFYEMTAESMEQIVFPYVKDYVYDIRGYFNNIEYIPLYSDNAVGYERAIWGVYLVQRYGIQIMKTIWERVGLEKPIPAMVSAFTSEGISLQQAFATFGIWNFYTGSRADTIHYYKDGNLFPPLNFSETQHITASAYTFQRIAKSYTMQYLCAIHNTDTVYYIISNANTIDALDSSHNTYGYTLDVSPQSVVGWLLLSNGMSYNFLTNDLPNWNVTPVQSLGFFPSAETMPFPNPFDPKKSPILFPTPGGKSSNATLYIFSSSMELIAEMNVAVVLVFGKECVEWNGKSIKGEFVASGIYFYVIRGEGIDMKGKFAVVR